MRRFMEHARARKKCQDGEFSLKRKQPDNNNDVPNTCRLVKKTKLTPHLLGHDTISTTSRQCTRTDLSKAGQQYCGLQTCASTGQVKALDQCKLTTAFGESWEVDSGFSSETSPPTSGRNSPLLCLCPATVVALDCEMVGTGLGGRCSELARCSILDYHGNILYDKYIRPCQPVTDYRTRWSGIQRHHLQNAVPFTEAREEILGILEGKVVVGHSIYNDFRALDYFHPSHMVRDTSATRLLSRLAGFPPERCASLKILASRLLDRRIQDGKKGHCSVQDAQAALDLYKLVEVDWEGEMQDRLRGGVSAPQPCPASSDHYMQDQYWPDHLTDDSQ
ncbi:apoptosis-enhancing nuclease [Lampris incognitus]|uniref:apoptosis-enhancing nuclease n=1 Tax=Lampris incognitus TaxID=2546036 RepID=UPI0024B4CEBA|nr:apoptosis-enhancing nuclease [Lampris incognitus]